MVTLAFSAVGASAAGDLAGFSRTPHGQLLQFLRDRGHELVEPSDPSATHFLSLDHNGGSLAAAAATVARENRQLVVLEPRVVIPSNYHRSIHRKFGAIISLTPELHIENGRPFLPWPQRDWRAQPPAAGVERVPGSTAIINANKISMIAGSLYGLRRRVIEAFASASQPLTLAGSKWLRAGRAVHIENARAVAYALLNTERIDWSERAHELRLSAAVDHLGIVDDKEAVLLRSEFAVVIENSAGYISEKLFDAIIAGCVPLFVGPELGQFGIPDDVVIRMPHDANSFPEAVRTLSAERKAAVLDAGRAWLALDSTFETWAMPSALARIAAVVDENIAGGTAP